MVENKDIKKVCVNCAGSLYKKYGRFRDIDYDELYNIGYIRLTEYQPINLRKAYSDAYLYMLHYIQDNSINRNKIQINERKRLDYIKRQDMDISIMIDMHEAFSHLSIMDIDIIVEHVIKDKSFRALMSRYNKKHPGSVKHMFDKAIGAFRLKLKSWF